MTVENGTAKTKPARTGEYLRVSDWGYTQSWNGSGKPVWIKLHTSLVNQLRWWKLTDAQRGQIVAIWLLAAGNQGYIPSEPALVKHACGMETKPDLEGFIEKGFLDRTSGEPWSGDALSRLKARQ